MKGKSHIGKLKSFQICRETAVTLCPLGTCISMTMKLHLSLYREKKTQQPPQLHHLKLLVAQTVFCICSRNSWFFLFWHPYLVFLNDWNGVTLWESPAWLPCFASVAAQITHVWGGGISSPVTAYSKKFGKLSVVAALAAILLLAITHSWAITRKENYDSWWKEADSADFRSTLEKWPRAPAEVNILK